MEKKAVHAKEAGQLKEARKEAKRQLDVEVRHQTDENETRALGRAMMSDAVAGRSINQSTLNLLNNFQGN